MAGKRTFVCFAAEDAFRAVPIIAALDAWEVAHTELNAATLAGKEMPSEIQRAIAECEVFLRLCTGATAASAPVSHATDAFRQLLEEDRRRRKGRGRRALINLILDPAYVSDPRDATRLYITTANKERARWLEELAIPLGVGTIAQRVSRRAVLGMGAGAALALASSGVATALFVRQQQAQALANQPLPVSRSSGQPNATFTLHDKSSGDNLDVPLVAADGQQIYAMAGTDVFRLSLADGTFKPVPLSFTPENVYNPLGVPLLAASQGLLFLRGTPRLDSGGNPVTTDPLDISAIEGSTGKLLWKAAVGDSDWPVVANGMLYSVVFRTDTSSSYVSAFSLKDGALVWQQRMPALPYSGGLGARGFQLLSVDAHQVYAGSTDHALHCFDAHTGAPRWQFQARGIVRGSTVAGDTVYAASEDYTLYAIDSRSGKLRWSFATHGGIDAAPAVDSGVVYTGSRDGFLYALDGATGRLYWSGYAGTNYAHESDHQVFSSPAIYHGIAFVTYSTDLFAFEVRTGKPRWSYIPVENAPSSNIVQPVVANGLVLFSGPASKVYAINP